VADLRTLKARERRELQLHALGYRYSEIAELTGSSYTNVISGGSCRWPACRRMRWRHVVDERT
jgi:hypothetical protein